MEIFRIGLSRGSEHRPVAVALLFFAFGALLFTSGAQAEGALDQRIRPIEVRAASPYQEGDLIFHQSQSAQSEALREGTGSPWTHMGVLVLQKGQWYVAEAIARVSLTPIQDFINRGKGRLFVVKRVRQSLEANEKQALLRELSSMLRTPYDIFFEWSDDTIYCSELVYKAYDRALGIQIGNMEKFRDMHLDGPAVQKLIEQRITSRGEVFNLDEPIITPISMMNSPLLETVVDRSGSAK